MMAGRLVRSVPLGSLNQNATERGFPSVIPSQLVSRCWLLPSNKRAVSCFPEVRTGGLFLGRASVTQSRVVTRSLQAVFFIKGPVEIREGARYFR